MAMSPYYVQYLLTQGDLFSRILSFNADFSARQSSLRAAKGNDDIKDSLYHVHPELARFHEKNNISYYFENSVDRLCLIRQEELETLLVYLGACISSSQLASLTRQEDKDTVYESIGRDTYEFALDYGYLIKNLDFMINIDGIKQDCIYLGLCAVKCLRPLFSRQDLAEYFIDFLITYARSHDLDPNIITSKTHVLSVVYNTAALHQVPSAEVMNNPVQYTPVDNHPRLAKGLSDLIEQAQIDELAAVAAATAPAVEAARAAQAASAQAADNSVSASGSAAAQSEAAQPAAQADAGNEAATGTGQEAPAAPEGAAATADAAASAPAQAAQSTDSATSDQPANSAQPAQQTSGQTDAKDAPAQEVQPENKAAQSTAPANAPEAAAAPAAQDAEGESMNKDAQDPAAAPADAAPADSAPADGAAAQPEDKAAADGATATDGQNAADNSAAPAQGENAASAEAASTQSQTAAPAADSAAPPAAPAASGSAAAQAPADSYIETVPDKYDDVPEGVGSPLPPTYESAALYGGLNSKDKRMFRAASHKQRTALLELEQADTQEKEIQTLEQEQLITLEFNEHQVYKLTHLILCSQISDNWYEYLQE
ncbi:hypothetical protein [Anaerobiospirillum sp. NML120511]|uniref:hypothetical protein n=2 Tax=unclassified Anaerobiospirillum TaxID=2647410 RepID=UPI001FF69D13|nr:hypothetical protein [Anaerobiospirillum sp. NML120511]MCK0534589.1 hypothetical protein [Anaerobiospirillum sp. NML120511]